MKRFIIDRFEGIYAVCETEQKTFITIPKRFLPPLCKEGDHLILQENGKYVIDSTSRKKAEQRIREKMNRLFE